VALLFAAPVVFLVGYGAYHLWESNVWVWLYWPITGCFALAYFLAWYWQRNRKLLTIDFTPPLHWTERDQNAWKLVEARARAGDKLPPDKLTDFQFYAETAKDMAQELAASYHPGAKDPVGALTIPEILSVIELAAHDLHEMVLQYVPAGHLMRVNDWRRARQLSDWYNVANNAYWIVSSLFDPINTGLRYVASRTGIQMPFQKLQQNIILWFYTAFVHRLGTYLIDLNSGRLRVGATRYRQMLQEKKLMEEAAAAEANVDPAERVKRVTLTVVGQVKAGKSSLINAILGEQRARTQVTPTPNSAATYELALPDIETHLFFNDTTGYGNEGPRKDDVAATSEEARQSDVVLLVLRAVDPGRQADLEMLKGLKEWFDARPDLKMPPVLGVLTHTDLLSPKMEWQPPYDWQAPKRLKEQQMAQAVQTVRDQLGEYLVGVVPVCTAEGKVFGVEEWLLPALTKLLDQAHAVALLRCLRAEADTGKVRKVFDQIFAASKQSAKVLWEAVKK
jgi:predicted GTPase